MLQMGRLHGGLGGEQQGGAVQGASMEAVLQQGTSSPGTPQEFLPV